jgi:antitoxin component of MazEF toxin-antitoxin module
MIKTITKIGNSQGIIFDSALLQLARLKVGDEVNVEVHAGGTITIAPIISMPPAEDVSALIKDTMNQYACTMKRLA